MSAVDRRGCFELSSDADQGVFGRRVAVAGWIEGRPLDVRNVIGTARRGADESDVEVPQPLEPPEDQPRISKLISEAGLQSEFFRKRGA